MDLILHQVDELHHVDIAHRHRLVEGLAGAPVAEDDLAHDGWGQVPFRFHLVYGFCHLLLVKVFALYTHVFQPQA
ncbi:hypothetical protein ES703_50284 [subsurface metagenome]